MLLPNRAVTNLLPKLILLTALSLPTVQALERGQRFKDWLVDCEKQPDQTEEICFITQTVVVKENDKPVLHVRIGYVPDEQGQRRPAALMVLPLGVYLPSGIGFKIDDGKLGRVQYERCIPTGCVAPFPLDDKIISEFKRGNKMEVRFHDGFNTIPVPVSLQGFTAGFNALK